MITEADIGWSAGIIDGEGCIGAYYSKRNAGSQLKVIVTNTDIRIIHRMYELWGGNICPCQRKLGANHKPSFRWSVGGRKACEVLRVLQPYLVGKGEQAKLALEFGKLLGKARVKLAPEVIAQRQDLTAQLQVLNTRGCKVS
jgi:hypothetical protein